MLLLGDLEPDALIMGAGMLTRAQNDLLTIHCAHRGADLSYGRLEDGGLRCLYHGWLYDAQGRCLEQPGVPASSTFHERIRQTAPRGAAAGARL
jgi:nitrite reductase/ring-hydroxylating ferredoxin subunit